MQAFPDHVPAADAADPSIEDLYAVLDEVGASSPLLSYVADAEEEFDEGEALDPAILAGLVHP